MNGLIRRIRRIEARTHTLVRPRDWLLLANKWKSCLLAAGLQPDDLKQELAEVVPKLKYIAQQSDSRQFKAALTEFAAKDRNAYYAYLFFNATDFYERNPSGQLLPNSMEGMLTQFRELRINARKGKAD